MRQGSKRITRLLGAMLLPVVALPMLAGQAGAAPAETGYRATSGSSAASASPAVSISTDGQNFQPKLREPILIGIDRYVPGDRNQRTVWVRNDSTDPAWLWSSYSTTSADAALLPFLAVSAAYGAQTTPGEVGRLIGVGQCTPLLPSQKIAAGQSVPMVVGVAFDPAAPNETRLASAEFAVNIGLTQDIGQTVAPNGCTETAEPGDDASGDRGSGKEGTRSAIGQLPETGAGGLIPWLALASATALAGFGFVAATRKRWPPKQRSADDGIR